MSRLRVAYDTTVATLSHAGPSRYALELAAALERRRDVELVPLAQRPRAMRGAASRIAAGLERELVYYPFELARRARAAAADIVHCPAPLAVRAGALPLVLTLHDAVAWRHPELLTRANALHARALLPPVARRAACVLTGSEFSSREIVELLGVSPERVAVTPYGVAPRFQPVAVDDEWLERRFGVHRPYVLAVGTLEPRKNLGAAVRAVARAGRTIPELRLVVAGPPGWGASGVDAATRGTAGVVATGFVAEEELPPLYAAATCFLYPSLYEGFGLPPLEAMACGAPVVASDRGSLPEVLGDAALLVDPADPDALADAVARVAGDEALARELAERGRDRAAVFTWDATAQATAAAYRQAASDPCSSR